MDSVVVTCITVAIGWATLACVLTIGIGRAIVVRDQRERRSG